MSEVISSPWLSAFKDLITETTSELFLVAPYITTWPLSWVSEQLTAVNHHSSKTYLVTDFNVSSLQSGSLNPTALRNFALKSPDTEVFHVPRLHAKVYLNDHTAIITSANLTANGMLHNSECGVRLNSKTAVAQTRQNVLDYLEIGSPISLASLEGIIDCVAELQQTVETRAKGTATTRTLDNLLNWQQEALTTQVLSSRVVNESIESIFRRTIIAILQKHGPLSTKMIHEFITQLQPDLCDESVDRIINGVHFGKKWKHQVRSAQVALKRKNLIGYDAGIWRIKSQ